MENQETNAANKKVFTFTEKNFGEMWDVSGLPQWVFSGACILAMLNLVAAGKGPMFIFVLALYVVALFVLWKTMFPIWIEYDSEEKTMTTKERFYAVPKGVSNIAEITAITARKVEIGGIFAGWQDRGSRIDRFVLSKGLFDVYCFSTTEKKIDNSVWLFNGTDSARFEEYIKEILAENGKAIEIVREDSVMQYRDFEKLYSE